ncbi:MAG: gamma-glutamyltransferase [Acidocella sp.]|nr:gamma-glutamyltransferase [Acidocella sp.]
MHSRFFRLAAAVSLVALSGCATLGHQILGTNSSPAPSQNGEGQTVFGYAVADEPQAALIGRQVLNQGGNAADAAAAEGFAMAVTLPSRAALGGGGACLVRMPNAQGQLQPPVALMFPAGSPAAARGGRPAAVPTMARGLLALQAGYGQLSQSAVIVPAERLAASAQLSPVLETDLQVVGSALLADPSAAAVFAPNGTLLPSGANLAQPDLAGTLEALRTQGVQGFYAGGYAQNFAAAAQVAGGGLTAQDLGSAKPRIETPVFGKAKNYSTAALPVATPAMETLPASASFMALDKNGGAVICVTSLNNLFGTGRIAPGTGVLLAASPHSNPAPDLAAAMAYTDGTFRAAASGTGQGGAAEAAQTGLANALAGHPAAAVPEPGRANVISCPGGVPGGERSCAAVADSRGQGLAIGGR